MRPCDVAGYLINSGQFKHMGSRLSLTVYGRVGAMNVPNAEGKRMQLRRRRVRVIGQPSSALREDLGNARL